MSFPTTNAEVLDRIETIDPIAYARTRNFEDGEVTRLSPYISRGFVSTKQVLQSVLARGFDPNKIEKFIQELAWRDYWQQVWVALRDEINADLKHPQTNVVHRELPVAVLTAATEVEAVDRSITELYETGYMHNHMRMYVAAIACNIGQSHWHTPAKWMYYHLLDGDWASNALSWQWVAGSNSNKKYIANQENINKYFNSNQRNTFLDMPYPELANRSVPEVLRETKTPSFNVELPAPKPSKTNPEKPTLIYNYYNIDPSWRSNEDANRVLLLEPSVFEQYPVSKACIAFAVQLAKNIPEMQIYVGEFDELQIELGGAPVYFKEHPLNTKYSGVAESRDWMFSVTGYHRSFFAFWKKCKKEMKSW